MHKQIEEIRLVTLHKYTNLSLEFLLLSINRSAGCCSMKSKQCFDIDSLQFWKLKTCKEIDEMLRSVNASFDEAKNLTGDPCVPKPYPGPQGWKKWTITIILSSFLIFGLIGNLLSATIMFRRSRRGLSSYFYLALLAIIDICVLYTGGLLFLLETAFNFHPQLNGPIYCRLGFFIQHFFTYVSAWLIVAVTFERFVVVRFPFQSIRVCRLHVAYTITLIIFVFFAAYAAHDFVTLDIRSVDMQTEEGYHPNYLVCDLVIYRQLLATVDLCFYSILPSLFIVIFNILIVYTMFYAIKQRRNYLQASSGLRTTETCPRLINAKRKSSSSVRTPFFRSRSIESTPAARSFTHQPRHVNRLRSPNKSQPVLFDSTSATGIRLTCLLVIISFIFVVCTLPISIQSMLADLLPKSRSTARWQLTQLTLTLLMYFNHTVNFVLYCLTGRAFRHECRKLLCGLWTLKDVHITCTMNPHLQKHHHHHQGHQPIYLTDRHRQLMMQQARMKRSCV